MLQSIVEEFIVEEIKPINPWEGDEEWFFQRFAKCTVLDLKGMTGVRIFRCLKKGLSVAA